jgi:hypothetical protein
METFSSDQWAELFAGCRRSASHLEMRDAYAVEDEAEGIDRFEATGARDLAAEADEAERSWWLDLVQTTRARGVTLRRVRIVSEPVSDYIRYEHAGTQPNIDAGEDVRWLPRTSAARLALPGADFWLFDERLVVFNHFNGDGDWLGNELIANEPEVVKLCADGFEAAWALATPHGEYRPG